MKGILRMGQATVRAAPPVAAALVLCLLAALGCAGVPHRLPGSGLPVKYDAGGTPLARAVEEGAAGKPGASGFEVLNDSASGFEARLDLVDAAGCTLDLQYFIWDYDHAGKVLLERVLSAARRGVRVRILLDDFMQPGMDEVWCQVSGHPNVEVRLFNPFGSRHAAYIRRPAEFVARLSTLNHRMHNKLLAADGVAAIIGGRNIGDQYFGVNLGYNHRDLDVLCAGPVASELSAGFEEYWGSKWAVPVEDFWAGVLPSREEIEAADALRRAEVAAWSPWGYLDVPGSAGVEERLRARLADLVWAPGVAYTDPPSKVTGRGTSAMLDAVRTFAERAYGEVTLVTPYYGLLSKRMVRRGLEGITRRGIQVRLLTNSLDSIDGAWGHIGYSKARVSLLEKGVEIHELKPEADCRSVHTAFVTEGQELVLHTKVAVADCSVVFFGTMNLDLRSLGTNTEAAVVVESPELARRVLDAVAPDFLPQNSWRVELGSQAGWRCGQKVGDRDLVWLSEEGGEVVCQTSEPGGGSLKHVARGLLGIFPIDRLL